MESPFPAPGKTIKVKTFLPGAGNEVGISAAYALRLGTGAGAWPAEPRVQSAGGAEHGPIRARRVCAPHPCGLKRGATELPALCPALCTLLALFFIHHMVTVCALTVWGHARPWGIVLKSKRGLALSLWSL